MHFRHRQTNRQTDTDRSITARCIWGLLGLHLVLKPREGDISRIRRHVPNGAFVLSFGMQGVIAVVITHARFLVNQFRGFGGSDQ